MNNFVPRGRGLSFFWLEKKTKKNKFIYLSSLWLYSQSMQQHVDFFSLRFNCCDEVSNIILAR